MDLRQVFVWVVISFLRGMDCFPMILCVTLNPWVWTTTFTVPSWRRGDLVCGVAIREVVGGNRKNPPRALKRLGLFGPAGDVSGRVGRPALRRTLASG